jgi:hypothetical protein
MAEKFDYQTSINIVFSALREASQYTTHFSGDTIIGMVLTDSDLRKAFRKKIRDSIRAAGYGIRTEDIPVEPHQTVEHVALALTGLAGDSSVDDELAGDSSVDDELGGDPKVDDE